MSCFSVLVAFGSLLAGGPPPAPAGDTESGVIAVEVTGTLASVTFVTGPEDDSPRLASASVRAAGRELPLDCGRSVAARRELTRRFAHPGSTAVVYPQVVVKGRLEFRAPAGAGEGKGAAVPVVVVESLEMGNPSFK